MTPKKDLITIPTIEDLTRRKFISSTLAAALLIACGDDDDSGDDTRSVTVQHKFGSTQVTSQPERVFAFGPTDEDPIFALGVKPIGITDWWGNYGENRPWPWTASHVAATQPKLIPLDGEVHYEEIAALKPDLILGANCGMKEEEYQRLTQIAPTVAQSGEHPDWRTPWQVLTRNIATALEKSAEAERLIAGVDDAFAKVRRENPSFTEKTFLYVERPEGKFTIRGGIEPRVQVFTNMGLKYPAAYQDLGEIGRDYTDEQLSILDAADFIVWMIDEDGRDDLLANPLYANLNVARAGHHIFVTDETLQAAINWSTVLSLPYAAATLPPIIARAI